MASTENVDIDESVVQGQEVAENCDTRNGSIVEHKSSPALDMMSQSTKDSAHGVCLKRRPGASNVFFENQTLAIDYATSTKRQPWYKRLRPRKNNDLNAASTSGILELEVVQIHMPTLLNRRNASDDIVKVTPELVQQNYEKQNPPSDARMQAASDSPLLTTL